MYIKSLKYIKYKIANIFRCQQSMEEPHNMHRDIVSLKRMLSQMLYVQLVQLNPKYDDVRRLTRYGYSVYSQNYEDGMLQRIFKIVGCTNKFFVEFGVQNGVECNTNLLLIKGWDGLWIEANEKYVAEIKNKFTDSIKRQKLRILNSFVASENIETLFSNSNIPEEFDLLSIDIDGNDYWIWKAINTYRPRVIIIEYNAIWPSDIFAVINYDKNFIWDGITSNFGASLKALEKLGIEKGYSLVGCDFKGVNAFFVRNDLVGTNNFLPPYSSENHYEPYRCFMDLSDGWVKKPDKSVYFED